MGTIFTLTQTPMVKFYQKYDELYDGVAIVEENVITKEVWAVAETSNETLWSVNIAPNNDQLAEELPKNWILVLW